MCIDSREYAEWIAFDRLYPIGLDRADWHAAMIASVLANAFRGKGRRFRVQDFLPEFGPRPQKTPEQIGAVLMQFAKMHNARIAAAKKGKK